MWDSAYQNPLGFSQEEKRRENTPSDAQMEVFTAQARKKHAYCVKMATIFKRDAGKDILKMWRENTIEASAWSPSLAQQASLEAAHAHAFAREGQNAFVRDIELCIALAEECSTLEQFMEKMGRVDSLTNA